MKRNKILFVVFSILDVALIVFIVFYFLNLRKLNNYVVNKKAFLDLTKEDAFKLLRDMKRTKTYIPNGFINSDIIPGRNEYIDLLYSYSNANEINDDIMHGLFATANDIESVDQFKIDSSHNHYFIVSVDESKVDCTYGCLKGIIFDKNYLDIYQAKEGYSYNDRFVFRNFDYKFVKETMAILIYDSMPSSMSNIYDYSFDEYDDSFIYTLHCVGYGNNIADPDSSPYAINLIEKKFILDKKTGELRWQDGYNNNQNNVLKSIPISKEEIYKLLRQSLTF